MDETVCSHCGRYVGPAVKCPYCRSKVPKRKSILFVKYGALTMAFIGIIGGLFFAHYTEYPEVKLHDINPTMNFAYVKINGFCANNPKFTEYHKGAPRISFDIDDGSMQMEVNMYEAATIDLIDADRPGNPKIPAYGDKIEAMLQVQSRPDEIFLQLNTPAQIKVLRQAPNPEVTLADLNTYYMDKYAFPVGTRVNFTNLRVEGAQNSTFGDFRITLANPLNTSQKVVVVCPAATYKLWNSSYTKAHPDMMGQFNQIWALASDANTTGFMISYVEGNLYFDDYVRSYNWEIVLSYPGDIKMPERR